ncbi:MAG: LLM class F420-dependent oxidoreductase [Actinobacteria bacterium]|nr:MAG: LLM class F420-dependent oxidoreductase [Actinomycetota bacterium]
MKIGFALPQVGPFAGPNQIATAARRAEELGYSGLWVNDRVLWPTAPRAPYPAAADGALSPEWRTNLDALGTLTFAAAHTSRVTLGTSVLVLPLYDPVLLARRLTTLDILSEGRLVAGFGLGWSPDEYEATGTPWANRAARMEDALDVIEAIWKGGSVAHDSAFVTLPESIFDARPVQQPRPRVLLAAYSPAGMARIAARADGWTPAGIPIDAMGEMYKGIQQMAGANGRAASEIDMVVRANCTILDELPEQDRFPFVGSLDQIAADAHRAHEVGATEVFFDVQFSLGVDDFTTYLEHMETLAKLTL